MVSHLACVNNTTHYKFYSLLNLLKYTIVENKKTKSKSKQKTKQKKTQNNPWRSHPFSLAIPWLAFLPPGRLLAAPPRPRSDLLQLPTPIPCPVSPPRRRTNGPRTQ